MITEEEEERIIGRAVERALLVLPEVVGSLMASHAALHKINLKFYNDNPEFKEHRGVVQAVVQQMEGENPTLGYEELLVKAAPEIKRRILITQGMDVVNVPRRAPRNYGGLGLGSDKTNGEL